MDDATLVKISSLEGESVASVSPKSKKTAAIALSFSSTTPEGKFDSPIQLLGDSRDYAD